MPIPDYDVLSDSTHDSPEAKRQIAEWRSGVSKTLSAQRAIEAERTGANKMTSRLVTIFGSIITAAALGVFAWVWDAHATNAEQTSAIEQLESNPPTEHGHRTLEESIRSTESRIANIESTQAAINARMTRRETEQAAQFTKILNELRRANGGRRGR